MFQEPLSKELKELIEEVDESKDVEGITSKSFGKLFLNNKTVV